jgi:iron only hydrogenase large subunit-like protein
LDLRNIFDTNFAADLTIIEEGMEFLGRAKAALTGGKAVLPMFTSCSPGWIKYAELHIQNELDHFPPASPLT